MTDSDEEFAETVALVSAAYLLLEETSTVPVPRVYLTHAVETALAKDDLNFQRLFRVSRALFNNFVHYCEVTSRFGGFFLILWLTF
jgi:hypothetical protein